MSHRSGAGLTGETLVGRFGCVAARDFSGAVSIRETLVRRVGGGYFLLDVASKQEAVEWAKRARRSPGPDKERAGRDCNGGDPSGSCHPVLSPEARVALTLRVVGGLSSEESARLLRPDVAYEAIRLARTLAALQPDEPEVLGLLACAS